MRRLAIVCAVLSACSFEHGALDGVHDAPAADGVRRIDSALGAWSTPVEIPGLSSGFGDDDPSMTDDLLEIYWGSRRGGGSVGEDIWMASRTSSTAAWGAPVNVTELNTTSTETTMKVTGDGLAIFFTSTRLTSETDIYFSTRANRSAVWNPPVKISELSVNNYGDYAPFAQSNLRHLIMCGGAGTANEALWTSDRASTSVPWGARVLVAELDEPGISECDPVEPHPRALYYSTQRLSSTQRYDIYRAERANVNDMWGGRTAVTEVNTVDFNDRDPWVSPDERTMVFSSDRDGVTDRLYISTR